MLEEAVIHIKVIEISDVGYQDVVWVEISRVDVTRCRGIARCKYKVPFLIALEPVLVSLARMFCIVLVRYAQ